MSNAYTEIAFTPTVKSVQEQMGSRDAYAAWEGGDISNQQLGKLEREFIQARDSFYMATVSQTGWPYLQHRGGPPGFIKVLNASSLGFADFSGNRQYVSSGNLKHDDRVALLFMDYPNQARLKIYGHAIEIKPSPQGLLQKLEIDDYRARVERGFLIQIAGFDWNCRQHITPRYSDAEWQVRGQG